MTRFALALAAACVCAITPALAQPTVAPSKIPVFVRSQSAASGFTDPSKERQDSIKDLIKKIKDSKTMCVAESESDAFVILEVLDRSTSSSWTPFWGTQNRSVVAVRLMAGEYTADFTGDPGSTGAFTGYRKAAGQVVKQLDTWMTTNRERIIALKQATPIETTSTPQPPSLWFLTLRL
jgi:hypothetical protein